MRRLFLIVTALAGGVAAAGSPPGRALLGRGHGWITTAYWETTASEAVTEFRSTWKVPPEPERRGGQLIYLFNGITNEARNAILQPVLQWGTSPAGGGPYWAVA